VAEITHKIPPCQIHSLPYAGGDMDPNFWGLICVPLGIALCFGPVLLVAAFGKSTPPADDKDQTRKP
jgi:hypothetical protein